MIIRIMDEKDAEAVSAICIASFLHSVADTLPEQGKTTFSNIAASNAFLGRIKGDNLMLVAENDENIVGVIELKEGRHVAMLFIRPEHQKSGIGRKLLLSALKYAKVETVTVSASLSSVTAYEKYGFECSGEIGESAGLVYQPMEIKLSKEMYATSSEIRMTPI